MRPTSVSTSTLPGTAGSAESGWAAGTGVGSGGRGVGWGAGEAVSVGAVEGVSPVSSGRTMSATISKVLASSNARNDQRNPLGIVPSLQTNGVFCAPQNTPHYFTLSRL